MSTVLDVTRGIVCKVASPRCKSEIPPQEAHLEFFAYRRRHSLIVLLERRLCAHHGMKWKSNEN